MRFLLSFLFLAVTVISSAQHYDWPMWRYDAGRTACTPEQLAGKLFLQWQNTYGQRNPVWDDPLNQNLMQYDRLFEPVIAGNRMFIGFNDKDKVMALDLETGKEMWHFYADGPVRLPMVSSKGRLYFTSDDGYCYCLDNQTGNVVWKKFLAPATNRLLGNKRLISMWPARGGVVIKDGILYSAASIWPMMGTFIYAIDAENGNTIWKNEGTSDDYILQPHNYYAFAGIGPQGSFAISGDRLLVAGGRTVPGAFDLKTGKELYYRLAEGKQTGGAFIACNDQVFFNHDRKRVAFMYNSAKGDLVKAYRGEYPVIDGSNIYFSGEKITATKLQPDNTLDTLWNLDIPARKDMIKAGNFIFAADSNVITAVNVSGRTPVKEWSVSTDKTIERLLAAMGKLIAVSSDGSILVFGDTPVENVSYSNFSPDLLKTRMQVSKPAASDGYAVVYGTGNLKTLDDLVSRTGYSIIAFEKSDSRIKELRERYDNMGITFDRIAFLKFSDPASLPKYLSSLTLVNDKGYINFKDSASLETLYENLRPFGGKMAVQSSRREQRKFLKMVARTDLYGADILTGERFATIARAGALKGSADWTHNYGNISNTIKSNDDLAKAPLGILWFGGNSNMDVLPRHGHGPGEQVIDGKLIIEGINRITARDVYTGRVLWQRVLDNLKSDNWQVYYNESYDEENPLLAKYNQVHLAGANARGTNFVVTKEYVYVIEGAQCDLLDINTGETKKIITSGADTTANLGYIGIYDRYLILGNEFGDFPEITATEDEKESKGTHDRFDVTASKSLMVFDRFSGEKLWEIPSRFGFIHNSVIAGDGMLFCLDKMPVSLESRLKRRGEALPAGSRLLCVDIKTGEIRRQDTENIFGSWLGYSSEYKYLLQATAPSSDMLLGEDGKRMIVYNAVTGEKIWDKSFTYKNPPILHNDVIYTNGESYSLFTGDRVTEKDFITGEDVDWSFKREYGCGYVIASEHLLTFRSTAAGFVNLDSREGTSNLGGFKASCSANLIVANGVLNAPDYTRTCQCSYQNQTSLAFINMPWMNYWTTTNYKWSGKPVQKLGLNLNAPGDRVADNDVLWLDFPSVGGISPEIPVKIDTVNYFTIRKNAISVKSDKTPWISASAIGGIRSMEITLSSDDLASDATYRVNLYFSELENKKPGERVFDVEIQGSNVLNDFDIIGEAGQPDKEVIKSFSGIKAGKTLKIDMKPVKGNTIISGIELIREPLTLGQL